MCSNFEKRSEMVRSEDLRTVDTQDLAAPFGLRVKPAAVSETCRHPTRTDASGLQRRPVRGLQPARSKYTTAERERMSSGEDSFDAWNAGGGVDVWTRDRVGFRLELRDHVRPDTRGTVHYWTIRGGIAFR